MMELDITFDDNTWAPALEKLEQGGSIQAIELLSLLEDPSQDTLEQALDVLTQKHIRLDIHDLPPVAIYGEASARLRQEQEMARKNSFLTELPANDPLHLYLEEIEGLSTQDDIQDLGSALLAGNVDAHEKLVDRLLPHVVKTAKQYVGKGVLLLDLIQEASLGLWQGLGAYTGGDVGSYCDWWIHQHLSFAVLQQAVECGLGKKLKDAAADYRAVDEKLLSELGRNPTVEEIADALHVSTDEAERIGSILENARQLRHAKQPEPEDIPQDEDQAVENTAYFQMRQRVSELLSELDPQSAQLLTLRYGLEGGLPLDPQQVGAKLGLTVQEVTDREAAALAKLRQS